MSPELWMVSSGVLAATLSLLLCGLARKIGLVYGLVDHPRPGELQKETIPRTGGYAMLAALALVTAYAYLTRPVHANPEDDWRLLGVALGAAAILPLAYLDDRFRLGPVPQLLGQLTIAALPVMFGLRLGSIASPIGVSIDLPLWLDVSLTVLWIVGMVNAFNWLDTMDGLAAGIAAVAATVLFLRSVWFGQDSIAVLPLLLAAVSLGFLPWNFYPAGLFMGTCGSVFLGYALATASILGGAKVGTAFAVLAVPILDAAWVIFRRATQRRSPLLGGDREHLPHKLLAVGLSVPQAAILLYTLSGVMGWLTLTLHSPDRPPIEKLYLLSGTVLLVGGVLVLVTWLAARKMD